MKRLQTGPLLTLLATMIAVQAYAQSPPPSLRRLPSLADSANTPTRLPSLTEEDGLRSLSPTVEDRLSLPRTGLNYSQALGRVMRRIPPVWDPVAHDPRFHRLPSDNLIGLPDYGFYYQSNRP